MAGRSPTPTPSDPSGTAPRLSQLGAVVAAAVQARPGAIVVVACPGGTTHLAVDAIRSALARGAAIRTATIGRTGRATGLQPPVEGEVLVVDEAQWAGDDALAELAEPAPDGGAVVLVHRRGGAPTRSIGLATMFARRAGASIRLAPSTIEDVRDATGVDAAEAERRVELTGGRCDLLAAWELDGSLVPDVSTRLSLVDPDARHAAELLAFGMPADRVRAHLRGDDALVSLVVEGVLDEVEPGELTVAPGVAAAVRRVTTSARRAAVLSVLEADDSGVLAVDLAAVLDGEGDRSAAAGPVYLRAAGQLASLDPAAALRRLESARACGVPEGDLRITEARAALAAGDPHRALVSVDDPAVGSAADAADAALLRAAAWLSIGDLDAVAHALAATPIAPLAAWALVGAGSTTAAAAERPDESAFTTAAASLAAAAVAWSAGDAAACSEALQQAVLRHRADPDAHTWPATPEWAAALIEVQLGRLERAERLVHEALAERRGGPAMHRTHLLTSAWLAAIRGRLDDAAGVLSGLADEGLAPHEALWRAGIACSIALRDPDPDGLAAAVADAVRAADSSGRHLYDLGLLTDIAAATTRAGVGSADDLLGPAERAVARLGHPPALTAEIAWARLRVALCCDDADAVVGAARGLVALDTPEHHALRRDAATAVVGLDQGRVDVVEVERVSRALADAGSPHEAARLCGVAAVHTTSEHDARRLLKHSRLFRSQRARLKRAEGIDRDVVRLSEQEERVAQMVLEGHTHREIGASLFISAKTVEHHVAHIRTKLGAGSRAEMMGAIREYFSSG